MGATMHTLGLLRVLFGPLGGAGDAHKQCDGNRYEHSGEEEPNADPGCKLTSESVHDDSLSDVCQMLVRIVQLYLAEVKNKILENKRLISVKVRSDWASATDTRKPKGNPVVMTPVNEETLASFEDRLQDVVLRIRNIRKKLAESPLDDFRAETKTFRGSIARLEEFCLKIEYRFDLAESVARKRREVEGED